MNEKEYNKNFDEFLSKFSEGFMEKTQTNPMASMAFELLIRGCSPYEIIEQLLKINEEQSERIQELTIKGPPQCIIKVNEEQVKDIIKNIGKNDSNNFPEK